MIRFSIITCTYNAADVLRRTLQSVLGQTYLDIEHIIVDGASTDDTVGIATEYKIENDSEQTCHDVIITSEPDKGLYDAMNKGVARASGTYVLFLNAGDTFPSAETLQDIAAAVADGEELPGVIYGDTDIVDIEGRFLRHRERSAPEKLTWLSFRNGMSVCHQAFYALTDIAKTTPYNLKYRYSADIDWCIRIMKKAQRRKLALRKVDEVVANFLDGGMTTTSHKASLMERFRIMCRHYGIIVTSVMHLWFALKAARRRGGKTDKA